MALAAQTPSPELATLEDFLAIPECDRFHELMDGMILRKAMPVGQHGRAQAILCGVLNRYDGPGSKDVPGGWWFVVECEIDFQRMGARLRPDIAGWRLSTMSEPPAGVPTARPDWVCEVVSPERRTYDTVEKRRFYQQAGVPHYWLVDYDARIFTALSRGKNGQYAVQLEASAGVISAEPFPDAPIDLARLF